MDTKKIKEAQFEALLRLAVIECFEKEMAKIPPQDELKKMYTFSERHERRMKKLFGHVRRVDIWKSIRRHSYRVAAIFALILTLLFGALMTNDNVRAAVKETIVEWFSTFTRFGFTGGANGEPSSEWSLGYLPDSFVESESHERGAGKTEVYANENGEVLIFLYMPSAGSSIAVDNERTNYSISNIDGIDYYLFIPLENELFSNIIWERDGIAFSLEAAIDKDELIKIAVSVRKK